MSNLKGSLPLKSNLSESTLNRASQGFKRYNIMENNALTDLGKKRQSILLNNEYDSSESNIVMGNNSESNQSDLVSRNNEEREEEEDNDFPTANLELPSAGSTEKTAAVHIKNSKVRFKKDGQMRSNFGDMNFLPRETILDREVKFGAKFYGFFVAFWICVVFYGLNVVCGYSLNHGSL